MALERGHPISWFIFHAPRLLAFGKWGSRKSLVVFANDSRHCGSKHKISIPAARPPRHCTPSVLDSNDANRQRSPRTKLVVGRHHGWRRGIGRQPVVMPQPRRPLVTGPWVLSSCFLHPRPFASFASFASQLFQEYFLPSHLTHPLTQRNLSSSTPPRRGGALTGKSTADRGRRSR